jgi:serine/threonine protein kinase
VELYDYFDNPEDITLLMEWCNDADYFEKKIEQKHTKIKNEEKLRSYSMDILTGLEYIHKSNIIHADMKLPNILMQRPSKEEKEAGELPIVKICDFGVS